MVHRHRSAGLHCVAGGSASAMGMNGDGKMQMQPQPPQQMYPQHTGGFVQQQQYVQGPPVAGYYQQVPSPAPLSSQPTGGSYVQMPVQQQPVMPQQQMQPPMNGAQQLYGSA
jgi:hypothetical protein